MSSNYLRRHPTHRLTRVLLLRMTPALYELTANAAAQEHRTISSFAREALATHTETTLKRRKSH